MSPQKCWQTRRKKSRPLRELIAVSAPQNGNHISDERLVGRQNSAISALEIHWAELGWEISRVRTRADVIHVFSADQLKHSSIFELLRTPAEDSALTLTELRRQVGQTSLEVGSAYRETEEVRQLHERVRTALLNPDPETELELKIHCERLLRELEQTESKYRDLRHHGDALDQERKLAEAAFSQDEIVRLVGEGRYTLSPYSIACAIAGLPFISYRQSITRCKALNTRDCAHLRYEVFRAISLICERRHESGAELSSQIRNLPRQFSSAREELKRNFYFLRRAFDEVSAQNCRRAQLPFGVGSKYNTLTSSIPLIEELRARDQRLT